ncbi:hypothetical protein QBC34DRAFT_429933 [Podospora aff. communis PSN243]|uniref:Uncharacterized protein n=1 Tax=Podospora aff. communis PSN243 TaxID=3040156 RepID=A0AAV9G8Q1_9PEZI|nr:hypothetical protein QBC34DRAFT_429933 [Podospora aff. communis PSN243]
MDTTATRVSIAARSTRILGPAALPPKNLHEVLLSNGLASVQFIKSLGQDKVSVEEIGVDQCGHLYRLLPSSETDGGAGDQEPDYTKQYFEEVNRYEEKHKIINVRAPTAAAIKAFARAARDYPDLYEYGYVKQFAMAVRRMNEVSFNDRNIRGMLKECSACIAYYDGPEQLEHFRSLRSRLLTPAKISVLEWCELMGTFRNSTSIAEEGVKPTENEVRTKGTMTIAVKHLDWVIDDLEGLLHHLGAFQKAASRMVEELKL